MVLLKKFKKGVFYMAKGKIQSVEPLVADVVNGWLRL